MFIALIRAVDAELLRACSAPLVTLARVYLSVTKSAFKSTGIISVVRILASELGLASQRELKSQPDSQAARTCW